MPVPQRQILVVDLLRFACALLVVLHHFGALLPIVPPDYAAGARVSHALVPVAWAGWVGVALFFVISGYVIAASVARDEGPGSFLRRRALRLAPAAWLAASLTTLIALAAGVEPGRDLLVRWAGSVSFWPLAVQVDTSYWTLGVELSFYLLTAAGLATPWRGRALEPLALLLALASAAFWGWRGGWHAPETLDRWTDLSLLPFGGCFAVGIALAAIARAGASPARLATLALGLWAAGAQIAASARYMAAGLGVDAGPALPLALFAAGVAALAAAAALQPVLAYTLGGTRLRLLGLLTYPLYLLHQRVGMIAIAALTAAGVGAGVAVALTVGALLAGSAWVAAVAEPRLRAWLAARLAAFSRPRAPAPDRRPSASPRAG